MGEHKLTQAAAVSVQHYGRRNDGPRPGMHLGRGRRGPPRRAGDELSLGAVGAANGGARGESGGAELIFHSFVVAVRCPQALYSF